MSAKNEARRKRAFEKAARSLACKLVNSGNQNRLRCSEHYKEYLYRFSTLQILLTDEVEALERAPLRNHALALILVTDFCWQVLRGLGGRQNDDKQWLLQIFPPDYEEIDLDVGDSHFQIQEGIVDYARWIFCLHSKLRHPNTPNNDLLGLMRDPVDQAQRSRLLEAAKGVRQVLIAVQSKFDPTITVASERVT